MPATRSRDGVSGQNSLRSPVVGDEASARELLLEMQARLGRDPYEALGLGGGVAPGEVRNAFLTLTKTFHPAKFARMSNDIQRLANEVFLSLRAAHDTLSRTPVAAPTRKSGPLPTVQSRGTAQQPVLQRAPTGELRTVPTPQPRPGSPSPAVAPTPSSQNVTQPMRPFANARPAPAGQARPTTTTNKPAVATPAAPPARPSPMPVVAPAGNGGGVDRELAPILELLKLGQLAAARVALETLTARSPSVVRYQALLHYARGREAQLAKRVDEARVELQDALQLDPDLALAKSALAELFTRRK